MNLINIKEFTGYAAKAFAAALVPVVFMVLNSLGDWVGLNVPVDQSKVEAWLVALFLAVVQWVTVYFKANQTQED
jgi:uncharacterized membrane protein